MDNNENQFNLKYILLICLSAALGGLLFGYDTAVISGAINPITRFFRLTPLEVGWAVSNVAIGCIVGAIFSGYIAGKLGRKKALILAAIMFTVSAIGAALVSDFALFIAFRMIGGVAVGLASSVSPMYISEVSPKAIRGRAISMQNLAIVGGQVLIFIINYLIAKGATQAWLDVVGWRIMLGSEAIPCLLFCVMSVYLPESPRWLVMKQRNQQAQAILSKIYTPEYAPTVVSQIEQSLKESFTQAQKFKQQKVHREAAFWLIAFIASTICVLSQLSGVNVMMYFAPTVLENITGSVELAMFMTIWIGVVQLFGNLFGASLMDKIGRVTLLIYGSVGAALGLLICSVFMYLANGSADAILMGYGTLAGMLIFMFSFGFSWSIGSWIIVSEIFPNRMRSLGMSVGVGAMWISNFIIGLVFPMLNSNAYLMHKFNGAHSMWIFAIIMIGSIFFIKRYLPETKGVALEEMENHVLHKIQSQSGKQSENSAQDAVLYS